MLHAVLEESTLASMLATVAVGEIKCPRLKTGGSVEPPYLSRTNGTARSFMFVPGTESGANRQQRPEVEIDGIEVSRQAPTDTPVQRSPALSSLTSSETYQEATRHLNRDKEAHRLICFHARFLSRPATLSCTQPRSHGMDALGPGSSTGIGGSRNTALAILLQLLDAADLCPRQPRQIVARSGLPDTEQRI